MPELYMPDIQLFNFNDDLEMLKFITANRKYILHK